MNINKWLKNNCSSLSGKTIVITGTTGGIGSSVLKHLAFLGANVITGVRNTERAKVQYEKLKKQYPNFKLKILKLDLCDTASISTFANEVSKICGNGIDALINNAGVYAQNIEILKCGYEKHFFVNCLAPILLTKKLFPLLEKKQSKIVFVSSISIFFTHIDLNDIDSRLVKNKTKIYASSKKWLTLYAEKLSKELSSTSVSVAIVHPGVTSSSLFAPKYKTIKKIFYPTLKFLMRLIFPSTDKASLSEVYALYTNTLPNEWIGPTVFFNIYGRPKKKILKLAQNDTENQNTCYETINNIINNI